MWKKPWGYKEGFICGAGLFVTGLLLQWSVGGIRWGLFAWPVNIIVLVLFLLLLAGMHGLRKRVYCFGWLSHYTAAVSSLVCVAAITVIMGLVRQVPSTHPSADVIGFSKMLSFGPFVLLYVWLVAVLGMTILRAAIPFNVRKIPFLLNHAGLFVALLTATLGNADMQRLKMITQLGKTEWRAIDEGGKLTELPLAVELKEFTIHEYPPKLMLIDNETGQALPKDMPEHLLLEEKVERGKLLDWDISIFQTIPMAASVATEDTLKFTEFHSMGAAYAVYLKAVNTASGQSKEGWVSCGSFMFPYKALRLSEQTSLVMPEREPQRFVSAVTVYTQAGDVVEDTIEVNRPLKISGWNIYQLSYDETKGRWSDVSVFELVRDPWLPAVYAGIIMMEQSACLSMHQKEKKKERRRRYELGLFCSVCHCRFTLLGMGSFRCMAWKTPGSGIYLYLPGTGCLFQFHCRYVDFFGTSSDADDGRDPSVVFVFSSVGGNHHLRPLEV